MSKKPQEEAEMRRRGGVPSLSTRLEAVRYLTDLNSSRTRRKYTTNIQHIADALVAAGYTSLDKQAKALGIHRATAWTILKDKHKLDRLNSNTTKRMLANPELPQCVRDVLQRYVAERPEPGQRAKRRISQTADTADVK
jgi:hypothetical protein